MLRLHDAQWGHVRPAGARIWTLLGGRGRWLAPIITRPWRGFFLCAHTLAALGGGRVGRWTYAIGSVASIATTLNPNTLEFHNTMDQLNYFMRERGLPRGMRLTLRDYFSSARRIHQLNDDSELLDKMSPLLQGTVALAANKQWIDKIWCVWV